MERKKRSREILSCFVTLILFASLLPLMVGSFPTQAKAGSFTEDFSTTTYKDSAHNTSDWDTTDGMARLSTESNWEKFYDSEKYYIWSLAVYNGKLYAGSDSGTGHSSIIFVYDGTNWSVSYNSPEISIFSLAVYNGKLYAGSGENGIIYVYNGTTWSVSYVKTSQYTRLAIRSLAVYNGKLYAGSGEDGIIYVYNGTTWSVSYGSSESYIYSLAVYNGKLYAGGGLGGIIYVYDGTTWSVSYDSPEDDIWSLAVYNGKLYAGGGLGGIIYVYDGTTWSVSYDSPEKFICSLAVYNGKLYAGGGFFGIIYSYVTQKTIPRLAGDTRYETAVAISKAGWKTSDKVVLARGDLFPDALAGAPLAAKYSAPILITNPDALTQSTQEEITRLQAKEVFILGTSDAVSEKVEADLKEKCSISAEKIHRLGGDTRYETATEISKQLSPPANKTAIIAYGENYPDALASASAAAYKGMPILLVKKDQVPKPTQDVLKTLKIEKTIIVGQADVVSSEVENWLTNNGYHPVRLGGDTRYDTCKLICDYALANLGMGVDVIGVACGENFPDALTLGPLVGKNGAPLILVREFVPTSIKEFVEKNKGKISNLYVAGGSDVVSDSVVDEIMSLAGM